MEEFPAEEKFAELKIANLVEIRNLLFRNLWKMFAIRNLLFRNSWKMFAIRNLLFRNFCIRRTRNHKIFVVNYLNFMISFRIKTRENS